MKSSKALTEFIYFDSLFDEVQSITGFSMNQRYIFFWSLGSVWKLSLETQEVKKLRLYVSELELHTQIIMVRPVSKMNIVCIRVN